MACPHVPKIMAAALYARRGVLLSSRRRVLCAVVGIRLQGLTWTSRSPTSRPATIGIRIVSKYFGDVTLRLASAGRASSRDWSSLSTEAFVALSERGKTLTSAADCTAGSSFARRWSRSSSSRGTS